MQTARVVHWPLAGLRTRRRLLTPVSKSSRRRADTLVTGWPQGLDTICGSPVPSSTEYQARAETERIEDYILVSEPPPFGLMLGSPEFREDIETALKSFQLDVVIIDPWNAAARDEKQRDYSETFDAIRAILPKGKDKPALGIVAHTRKPKPDEKRTGGSGLMHLLAGSYVLTSVPRAIFVMVRGNSDEADDSVVWFNPKNSNGPCCERTAWERGRKGLKD